MYTTIDDIRGWLNKADTSNYSHMIVVCDRFDYTDYPCYVDKNDNLNHVLFDIVTDSMTSVVEVYDLSKDYEEQLARGRNWAV